MVALINREQIAQTGILPDGLQLFQDTMPLKILETKKVLSESATGQKVPVMRLTGIFQRADEKNANGRVYPEGVLKEAIGEMQENVGGRRVMGEFDHPPDAKIHMDRVSHLITKLWMDGKTVMGELEVINDNRCPYGAQLACFMDRGVQVGISSRGVGDMEMVMHEGDDAYEVQPGFQFVTFDAVAEPSVTGTQLQKITESVVRNRGDARMNRILREGLLRREVRRLFL